MAMAMAMAMARAMKLAVKPERVWHAVNIKRACVAMATIGLAVGATISAAQMISRSLPGVIPSLRTSDPVALSTDVEARLSTIQEDPSQVRNIADLAMRSIRAQALNPVALRQLAIARVISGQKQDEDRLMRMSNRLSRRDLGAQLWLIDSNVRRNDVPAVLRAYDTALRINDGSWPILFPILNIAIEDQSIQDGLRPYWSLAAPWREPFIAQAIATSPHPEALAAMAMRDGMLDAIPNRDAYRRNLIAALLDRHQFSIARTFALRAGLAPAVLVSPSLSTAAISGASGRLGWQFVDLPDRGAAMKSATVLNVFAVRGASAGVASKILYVRPGTYRLVTQFGDVKMEEGSSVMWRLFCPAAGDPRLVWTGRASNPGGGERREEPILVPADCPTQLLELVMAGGDDGEGAEAEISRIELRSAD
jgi:hypothetical protein